MRSNVANPYSKRRSCRETGFSEAPTPAEGPEADANVEQGAPSEADVGQGAPSYEEARPIPPHFTTSVSGWRATARPKAERSGDACQPTPPGAPPALEGAPVRFERYPKLPPRLSIEGNPLLQKEIGYYRL